MPNSIFLFVANKITGLCPISRMFKLKSFCYRIAGIHIENSARLQNIKIVGLNEVTIGKDTFIGGETLLIGGKGKISIGDFCDISNRVIISTGTHVIDPNGKRIAGKGYSGEIVIEDGVWIGIGSTVLPNVTIGEKTIIAAGSVVNKSIPAKCIAGGVPCKVIRLWDNSSNNYKSINS